MGRKEGLSPADRLARLAGAARPASEHPESGKDHAGEAVSGTPVTTPTPPNVPDDVTSHVTGSETVIVPEAVSAPVVQSVTGAVPPPVTAQVTSNVTEPVTEDVPQHTSSHVTPNVTDNTPSHVTSQVETSGLAARVRGRWTQEQKTYLAHLAKDHRAKVGEIIRFIMAWRLAQGGQVPVIRTPAPSPDGLVRRETGLIVMDFLTTADQAAAIKQAADGNGEAAWMRHALNDFRDRGPWSKKA